MALLLTVTLLCKSLTVLPNRSTVALTFASTDKLVKGLIPQSRRRKLHEPHQQQPERPQ